MKVISVGVQWDIDESLMTEVTMSGNCILRYARANASFLKHSTHAAILTITHQES